MLLPKIIQNIITLKSSPNGGLFCAFSGVQITLILTTGMLFAPFQVLVATTDRISLTAYSDCSRIAFMQHIAIRNALYCKFSREEQERRLNYRLTGTGTR